MESKKKWALLVMDYQQGIIDSFPEAGEALIGRVALAISAARKVSAPVVYVSIGFRTGYPEVADANKSFDAIRGSGRFVVGAADGEIHAALRPAPEDWRVLKHRVSAFSGSDLEMLLRSRQIETLVLAGIATSGVVLSTLRQAADMDFGLVVLRDACADRDAEVHACLMEKVFPRQAEIQEVASFCQHVETR